MPELVIAGSIVATLSYLGVAGIRAWARRHHLLDIPNQRSSHSYPTPRGGGLAIVVTSLLGFLLLVPFHSTLSCPPTITYVVGAALIAAVSWLDDLHSLSSRVRLLVHGASAGLAVVGLGYWHHVSVPFMGQMDLGWLGLPISLVWIVGLTNAYNFMDGTDGMAGTQAVVAGGAWAVLASLWGQPAVATLGLLVAAASLGFLGHNWPPARIFMGDVGAAFLGYTFAVLPILAAQANPRLAFAGVLLVWPFIFDTAFTLLRRLRRGENVFAAHRSHLYQRLVIAGASHRAVALLYAALAAVGLMATLYWLTDAAASALLVVIIIPSLCALLWLHVLRRERHHRRRTPASQASRLRAQR